ncbi:MAG: ATP-binding protein [Candidatus Melainabacteria bacterium]|nr:ATP-binding protein [Candidatus Melainabacteria bacterium]
MKNLSLKQIGILVLSIPLICQIIFSTVLYINVSNAQKTVQTEITAKAYTVTIQKLVTAMLERVLAIRLERHSNGANLVAEARTTKDSFDSIAKQLFLYEALSPQATQRLTNILHRWAVAEKQLPLVTFDYSNPKELENLEKSVSSIFSEINLVGKEVAAQGNEASEQNLASLRLVREYLYIALLVSSLGGIFLAWLVGQLAYRPISHILANAGAMVRNRNLKPLNSGPPELMAIDHALREISRKLSYANSRQQSLYQLSPAFLLELSETGQIIKGNQIVSQWLQFDERKQFFDFFDGAHRLRLESQFELARESKTRRVFRLSADKLLSFPSHTQWTITYNDQSHSFFCVAHDITDSTNVEQLRDQISRYLTIELGAPLKTIASLIAQTKQLTLNEGRDSWTNKQLLGISNNVERLTNLLNQLDHSTDPSNLEQASSQGVSSNKIAINHATEAVRSLAQAKKVQIINKVEWAMVRATESELERVLINLISNAIKYTPEDSRIEILSQPEKDMVRFAVVDQGSGIPEQSRQEVFAPFKQLANAKAIASPSSGLGLSVCKTIVERAGGKIWVETGKSGGAAFNFLLPADAASGQKLID